MGKFSDKGFVSKVGIGERKRFVSGKLTFRMSVMAVVFLVSFFVGVWYLFEGFSWFFVLGFAVGLLLGLLAGRVSKIVWDKNGEKVVAKIDLVGFLILGCYVVFAFFRRVLFSYVVGDSLSLFMVWFVIGVVLGRMISLRFFIFRILR